MNEHVSQMQIEGAATKHLLCFPFNLSISLICPMQ